MIYLMIGFTVHSLCHSSAFKFGIIDRITKHLKLEGTHKDYPSPTSGFVQDHPKFKLRKQKILTMVSK